MCIYTIPKQFSLRQLRNFGEPRPQTTSACCQNGVTGRHWQNQQPANYDGSWRGHGVEDDYAYNVRELESYARCLGVLLSRDCAGIVLWVCLPCSAFHFDLHATFQPRTRSCLFTANDLVIADCPSCSWLLLYQSFSSNCDIFPS